MSHYNLPSPLHGAFHAYLSLRAIDRSSAQEYSCVACCQGMQDHPYSQYTKSAHWTCTILEILCNQHGPAEVSCDFLSLLSRQGITYKWWSMAHTTTIFCTIILAKCNTCMSLKVNSPYSILCWVTISTSIKVSAKTFYWYSNPLSFHNPSGTDLHWLLWLALTEQKFKQSNEN